MKIPMVQMTPRQRRKRRHAIFALLAFLPGCSTLNNVSNSLLGAGPQPGAPGYVAGFLGGVVADEPRAALAGREVLSSGGTAGDAAVAVALTLAVTLPSRAGLGGGGACLAYASGDKTKSDGVPDAIMFVPPAASGGAGGDRPAAVPMLARGMYLLSARYGSVPFETIVSSVEQLARFGVPVSRALARDLSVVSGPLFTDPSARAVFSNNGVPLTEGQTLRESELGATLAQIRVAGVGDMYVGTLALRIAQASQSVGGPISLADLRNGLPKLMAPLIRDYGNDKVAFLPPPADGGLAAEAAFNILVKSPDAVPAANSLALAVAARWRAGGVTPESLLASQNLPAAANTAYPASTSFVTMDRNGNAVACALTMNNLFGTGRILPGVGFIPAASPSVVQPPLLSAGLVWNQHLRAFRAAAAASGQFAAPVSVAFGLANTLRTNRPLSVPVPDPGRLNIAACAAYLPGESGLCGWATDPRGDGLAIGAN
jgi:gamma-glutamyltranspeptidase / glutathione hydrolase